MKLDEAKQILIENGFSVEKSNSCDMAQLLVKLKKYYPDAKLAPNDMIYYKGFVFRETGGKETDVLFTEKRNGKEYIVYASVPITIKPDFTKVLGEPLYLEWSGDYEDSAKQLYYNDERTEIPPEEKFTRLKMYDQLENESLEVKNDYILTERLATFDGVVKEIKRLLRSKYEVTDRSKFNQYVEELTPVRVPQVYTSAEYASKLCKNYFGW